VQKETCRMQTLSLLGSMFGLALLSGLNLYAAALTVGLAVRYNIISLPLPLQGLEVLAHPAVLVIAGLLYAVEFIADKIPWVDSAWDAVHTFVRPLGAAALGLAAFQGMDPVWETAAALVCGGLSLSSHSTKAATRLIVNQSPEPVSNSLVSLFEDVLVVVGSLLFLRYPALGMAAVGLFLALMFWLGPKLLRLAKMEFAAVTGSLRGDEGAPVLSDTDLPDPFRRALNALPPTDPPRRRAWVYSGKGFSGGRFYAGLLVSGPARLAFITRRWFKVRTYEIALSATARIEFRKRPVLSVMHIESGRRVIKFYGTRDKAAALEALAEGLRAQLGRGEAAASSPSSDPRTDLS